MMPKVRGEWPEATAALWGQRVLIKCKTDISHPLLYLSKALKNLDGTLYVFPSCTYLALNKFELTPELSTMCNFEIQRLNQSAKTWCPSSFETIYIFF